MFLIVREHFFPLPQKQDAMLECPWCEFHLLNNFRWYKELQNIRRLIPASMLKRLNDWHHDQRNYIHLTHTSQKCLSLVHNPPKDHPWCSAPQDKSASEPHMDFHL